jgi:DNA-binding MarR family transcriptional regulator
MSTNDYSFVPIKKYRMIVTIRPLGATLAPLRGIIPNALKTKLKQEDITIPFEQLIVLKIAKKFQGKAVQQDIATKLGKDKSVVLRMVDALEKEGLLKRLVDSCDRRRNLLEVTPSGDQLLGRLDQVEISMSKELMEGLDENDIAGFYKVIDHIVSNADKRN